MRIILFHINALLSKRLLRLKPRFTRKFVSIFRRTMCRFSLHLNRSFLSLIFLDFYDHGQDESVESQYIFFINDFKSTTIIAERYIYNPMVLDYQFNVQFNVAFSFFFRKNVFNPYERARGLGPKKWSPSSADSTLDFKKILKGPKMGNKLYVRTKIWYKLYVK